MYYQVRIQGIAPMIQHSSIGVDSKHPANVEKAELTKKKAANRTAQEESRIASLDTIMGFWLDGNDRPTVPSTAIRACLETAARKLKQGGQVREGLTVVSTEFEYDEARYGTTLEQLAETTQFRTVVVVQRQRIIRTRPQFDLPWAVTFRLDTDADLVDQAQLRSWLDIAGRRIGLGDWRPEKSGTHGRFEVVSIEVIE